MIQIYLCDDEESVRHQLRTALEWKICMEDYDMKVVCAASTAQELLEAVEDNSRSIYFLDVDLRDGEWDGFTLGRELRISPVTAIWPGRRSNIIWRPSIIS